MGRILRLGREGKGERKGGISRALLVLERKNRRKMYEYVLCLNDEIVQV